MRACVCMGYEDMDGSGMPKTRPAREICSLFLFVWLYDITVVSPAGTIQSVGGGRQIYDSN